MNGPLLHSEVVRFISEDLRVWEKRLWGWKFLGTYDPSKGNTYQYENVDHIEDIIDGEKE